MYVSYCLTALLAAVAVLFSAGTASADMLDLTGVIEEGIINGALFQRVNPKSTGSGVIDSFVRIHNNGTVEGYNTDGRPIEFDENTTHIFNHSLLISAIPTVSIGGTPYRQFMLDINEKGSDTGRYISLDKLEIYLLSTGDRTDYSSFLTTTPPATPVGKLVYTMDPGGPDNWIKLDYKLNSGSGSGDMFANIPNSLFTGPNQYVYLYSRFGDHYGSDAGFEEWAVKEEPVVPEPSSLLALLTGAIGLGGLALRRRMT
jgi:hypothetical protein